MSLVIFPFKQERPDVLIANVRKASRHARVSEVLGIGYENEETYRALETAAPAIAGETGAEINLALQRRIGSLRPGKGDAMNTGLDYFLASSHDRLHFYDADIVSFGEGWIDKAETAADRGYDVVRHYFPRARTDAMITWMITRTGFSLLWPDSELVHIEQPLGGELLLTRAAAKVLVDEPRVRAQSDWGIDTVYTFVLTRAGLPLAEVYIPEGKIHKLYGALSDLRTMLRECFAAVQSLRGLDIGSGYGHEIERPGPVPAAVASQNGYNLETTLRLLTENWTQGQEELLELFPGHVRDGLLEARTYPRFGYMDDETWYESYRILLDHFDPAGEDWAELLFKLWVARVLHYTANVALRGFDFSSRYLHDMVVAYAKRSARAG